MIPPKALMPTGVAERPASPVPARVRALAAQLATLFETDQEIVERLNDAQHRLAAANERLWSGLAPDTFSLIYQGVAPAGHSHIAKLIKAATGAGGPGPQSAVLQALQDIHWQVHRAFCAYQSACEERRQLAVDVGELSARLTDALTSAGYSPQQARSANVHQLADGTWPAADNKESKR
jgi:hypothetical protein